MAIDKLTEKWGQRYPAVIRLRKNAWAEFIPFLDYDVEIRQVIWCGHFPSEQAAMKCRYLVTRPLDPTGVGRARRMMRWKPGCLRQ